MSEEQASYEVNIEAKDRQALFDQEFKKPVDLCECDDALQRLVLNKHTLNVPARVNDEDILISRALRELGETREQLQSAQQEIDRLTDEIKTHAPHGRNYTNQQYVNLLLKYESVRQEIKRLKTALHTHESYDVTVSEMHEREQKLIGGLREVYALIENVEDYANVKYARDEIERLFKELGVTE